MNQPHQRSGQPLFDTALEIEIDARLEEAAPVVASLEQSLPGSLRHLLRTLGLSDAGAVSVRTGQVPPPARQPVAIWLNARPVRYSSNLASSLAIYFGSSHEDIHSSPERIAEYLDVLILEAIKARLALLIGPAQLDFYRQRLRTAGAGRAAESPHLERALTLALRLWLSVADVPVVARAISSADGDGGEAEVLEAIVAALRPREIQIRLPLSCLRALTDSDEEWTDQFKTFRTVLGLELGLSLPPFRFVLDESLNPLDEEYGRSFCFGFNSLTTSPVRGLTSDEFLVNETVERLAALDVIGVTTFNAANGWPATIVRAEDQQKVRNSGKTMWDARQYLILCLGEAVGRHCGAFLDQSILDNLLAELRNEAPKVTDLLLGLMSRAEITAVFRELLADQVPIRNVRKICDLLLDAERETELNDRVTYVRAGMQREITSHLSRATSVLPAYLVDVPIIDLLEGAATSGLEEIVEDAIIEAVRSEVNALPVTIQPAIIATAKSRGPLQALLRDVFPRVRVTTFDEIASSANVQPVARISV
jgi:hypothetical protein